MVRSLDALLKTSLGVALLAGALPSTALAQACPPGAITDDTIPSGSTLKLVALHAEDAYHGDSAQMVGIKGTTSEALSKFGECWYGGPMTGADGTSYYFYKGAFTYVSKGAAGAGGATACPTGASMGPGFDEGARVKLLGLHPDDAYYGDSSELIGLSGSVNGDLHSNDGCWMGGGFTSDEGNYYYFYKGAFVGLDGTTTSSSASTTCPAGATLSSPLADGTKVKLLGLHPDDAYYSDRGSMVGLTGKVDGDLHSNDGCWMGGGLNGDDGRSFYFYKGAFEVVGAGGGSSGDRFMGDSIRSGATIRLVALDPEDAYFSSREDILGKTCTAADAMPSQGKGWYSGGVNCTDGSYYYFFKVGVVLK